MRERITVKQTAGLKTGKIKIGLEFQWPAGDDRARARSFRDFARVMRVVMKTKKDREAFVAELERAARAGFRPN